MNWGAIAGLCVLFGAWTSFAGGRCYPSLSPSALNCGSGATNGAFAVTSSCAWTAASTNSWIHPTGSGSANGTILYSVDANPTFNLRTGSITAADTVCVVTQSGVPRTLGAGLGNTNLVWVTADDYPWAATNPPAPSFSGSASAVSGNRFKPNTTSWVQTTAVGPGTLGFWWKVDSDVTLPLSSDVLEFQINDEVQDQIMGQIDWKFRSYAIPEGTNILRWQYVKDAQYNSAYDQAWLDTVTYTTNPPIPVYQALDTCGADWISGGNDNPTHWSGQTEVSLDGVSAARSGPISMNQESWLETTVSGITNLSFWWKVSSKTNYDYLEFYTNSVLVQRITGEIDWRSNNFKFSTGTQVLKWRFFRVAYSGTSSARNCGWLDEVVFSPPLPLRVQFYTTNITLSASATGCSQVLPDLSVPPYLVVADNCSSVTVTQAPAPGTVLDLGATQVVFTIAAPGRAPTLLTNKVTVADTTAPSLVLLGENPVTNECHGAFVDPGATASDSCSGMFSLTTNSAVNPNQVGEYTIAYVATDTAGNASTNTRTVYIRDTQPPMLTLVGSDPIQVECHQPFVDPGATASDACAGSLPVTTTGSVDSNSPGTYTLTYSASDGSNTGSVSRTVRVVDTTPPQILSAFGTLVLNVGATNCSAQLPDLTGSAYVTAVDACGSVTVAQQPVPGTTLPLGTNFVVISVSDNSANSMSVTNTVVVEDAAGPSVVLLGANPLTNECHAPFVDPGATASDLCSGVFLLTTNSTVNPNLVGTYSIIYVATDAAGNASTNTRLVYVRDTQAPVVTLIGADPIQLECHQPFVDPGATASDACAGSLPVSTTGAVDPNTPGTYVLTYSASDGFNTGSVSRTVHVVDTTAPEIVSAFGTLVMTAAVSTCSAVLPDLTGPAYVVATDVCGAVTVTQLPVPGATLPLGTNAIVLTAADSSANLAQSTNYVVVVEAGPSFSQHPLSVTNRVGETVSLSVDAAACSPVRYQWYFHGQPLPDQSTLALTLSNAGSCDAGEYFATATADSGVATSAVAVVTLVNAPDNLSPGGSQAIGSQRECGQLVLAGASTYAWEISDPLGEPGTGWDSLSVDGPILLQASVNAPVRLKLVSLPPGPGSMAQFDPAASYTWTIAASGSGVVLDFDPAAFALDTAQFQVPFTGSFHVVTNASGLALTYAGLTVPPQIHSSAVLGGCGFRFALSGPRGQTYRVLAAADLSTPLDNWLVLTNSRFLAGTNVFVDPEPTLPQRFYRVASP